MVSQTPRGLFRRKRPTTEKAVDQLHTLATVILAEAEPLDALSAGVPPDSSYDAALYAVESLIQTPRRVVVVTGVSTLSASSTVATGLALVAAAAGRRVVLVDANLGAGQVAASFGLHETSGLSDVLVGSIGLGDAAVRPIPNRDLLVIPAGQHSAELAGPLPAERATKLLEYLSGASQLVVIDSDSEALGVPGTGWGAFADGVLLVADRRLGGDGDGSAVAATIRQAGGHVLGLIRTQAPGAGPAYAPEADLFSGGGAAPMPLEPEPAPPAIEPAPGPEPAPVNAEPEPAPVPIEPPPEPAPEPELTAPGPVPQWRVRPAVTAAPAKRPAPEPRGPIEAALSADRIAFSKPELSAAARRGALRPGRIADAEPPAATWRSRPRQRRLRRATPAPEQPVASGRQSPPPPRPAEAQPPPDAPPPIEPAGEEPTAEEMPFEGNWVESALDDRMFGQDPTPPPVPEWQTSPDPSEDDDPEH